MCRKHLEVKLPYTATHTVDSYVHYSVHEDVIAFFSVQDGNNIITQQDGEPMLLDLYMGQKPSSRRQVSTSPCVPLLLVEHCELLDRRSESFWLIVTTIIFCRHNASQSG